VISFGQGYAWCRDLNISDKDNTMTPGVIQKRVDACLAHMQTRGLTYEIASPRRTDILDRGVVSLVKLTGNLAGHDIVIMDDGMTAMRARSPGRSLVLLEQAIPEFIVDFAKDLDLGCVCSHLQEAS
jgi:hypothetical protein